MKPPNIRTLQPLAQLIYNRHSGGCCLHIVLDDGNVDNDHVEFCLKEASVNEHQDCFALAVLLRECSRTQRIKLGHLMTRCTELP